MGLVIIIIIVKVDLFDGIVVLILTDDSVGGKLIVRGNRGLSGAISGKALSLMYQPFSSPPNINYPFWCSTDVMRQDTRRRHK